MEMITVVPSPETIATLFLYFLCVILGVVFLWNIIRIIRFEMTIPEKDNNEMPIRDVVSKVEISDRPQEFTGIRAIQL